MTNLETLAQKVHENIPGQKQVFLDPASISLYITIIKGVIVLLEQCKETPETALVVVHHPTRTEEVALKKEIRKQLGIWNNWRHGSKIYEAMVKTGKQVTLADLQGATKECQTMEYKVVQ